jgi:glycosyltransferase involved in cell wall biosynthesis
MHILFLSHYFPPEVNAPASRTYENTKRWVKAGHKITVITCAPNHPRGILYTGYKNKLRQWDEKDGISIFRVKTYLSANKGFLKRTLNYISFMVSATLQCYKVKGVDIVVSTSPQFFCGMAGYFISRLKATPWILEIRDLWPESIIAVGALKDRRVINLLEGVETFLYRRADQIVALTNAFKRHIMERGVRDERISVVTNGADLERYRPRENNNSFRASYSLNGKFVASYVGTHGMAHALETILQAAKLLEDKPQIQFMLVGDGAERENLIKSKDKMGLKNVLMLPQQKKENIPEILAASDTCMVLLRKSELFKTVIPSKIFEAMAMEKPIVLGVQGESTGIISNADCGICIEPENSRQLADAILELSGDPEQTEKLGKNGGLFVRTHYNRDNLAMTYLDVLTDNSNNQPQIKPPLVNQ